MQNEKKVVTIGDLMHTQKRDAMRATAIFMAVLLYAAVLIYTGVHNYNLATRTLPADQQVFGLIALICLEGGAIFLPLATHFWLAPGPQRMVGYVLYGTNFGIVIMNTIVDAITNKATAAPEWLTVYATYIFPATPILIGIGVAFMFLLDPSKKLHDAEASAKAAAIDAQALHMREAASGREVNAIAQSAAIRDLLTIVGNTLGSNQANALPAKSDVIDEPVPTRPATVQMAAQPEVNASPTQPTAMSVMSDFANLSPDERAKIMAYLQGGRDGAADGVGRPDSASRGDAAPL